jgi:hypothetical protein
LAEKYNIMRNPSGFLFVLFISILYSACYKELKAEDPSVWKKIKINFKQLDHNGLSGPEGGKVAIHYEFCVPAEEKYVKAVKKIDPTAEKHPGSGRVGCGNGSWLMIGTTQQKNYKRVLYELASAPWIKVIEETFWE